MQIAPRQLQREQPQTKLRQVAPRQLVGLARMAPRQPAGSAEVVQAVVQEVCSTPPSIISWLENVVGASEVAKFYSKEVGSDPLLIQAEFFGWVNRSRLFWASIDGVPMSPDRVQLPE